MLIERTTQGFMCSDIVAGHYVHKHYIGYTKREALAEFKQFLKDLKKCK